MPKQTLHSIEDFDLKDQRVFIRTDFNVPVKDGAVLNHIRLRRALPVIRYALEQKAKVIIGSHRGRPERLDVTKDKELFSLEPFGYYLGEQLGCEVLFIEDIESVLPSILLSSLNSEKLILLENLRFHPGEEQADAAWAKQIASYVDVYVNEAFSVSHRRHASVCLLPQEVQKRAQGISLKQEIQTLDYIRESSPRPMALLVGGGVRKAGDKIKTISALLDRVDTLLIGGVIAYAFLKTQNVSTGDVDIPLGNIPFIEELIQRLREKKKKLFLPVDHVIVPKKLIASYSQSGFSEDIKKHVQVTETQEIPDGFYPVDIGPKTRILFGQALKEAKTIFWNGPLGWFEEPTFAEGTLCVCQEIADLTDTFRVVGGGDSIAAVFQMGYAEHFNYISTGGGAALKYLETGTLPGIQSLKSFYVS